MRTTTNSKQPVLSYDQVQRYGTSEAYFVHKMRLDEVAKALHFAKQFDVGDTFMVHDTMYDDIEHAIEAETPTYKDEYMVKVVGIANAEWNECYCSIFDMTKNIRLVVLRADICGLHMLMLDPHEFWLDMSADLHFDNHSNIIAREISKATSMQFDEYVETMFALVTKTASTAEPMSMQIDKFKDKLGIAELPASPVSAMPLAEHYRNSKPSYSIDLSQLHKVSATFGDNGAMLQGVQPDGSVFKAFKTRTGRWLNIHGLDFEGKICTELDDLLSCCNNA